MGISPDQVSLREFLEARIQAVEKSMEAQRDNLHAEVMALKELWHTEHVSLQEQMRITSANTSLAVSKSETSVESRFQSVNEFRATLADQQREFMPRPEVNVLMSAINQKYDEMNGRFIALSAELRGNQAGKSQGWGWAIGALGIILTVLSIIAFFMTNLKKL